MKLFSKVSITLFVLTLLITLIITAPATLLNSLANRVTQGRLLLTNIHGSILQGTATPVIIYKQFDTAYTYTGNFVQVTATKTSATVLTFTTEWFSSARSTSGSSRSISGGTATTGITFGTAPTTVVTYFPPSTTNLSNTWGSTSVASTVSATPYS